MIPKRIQLSRKKGWRKPANVRVVTRATRFGNPYIANQEYDPAIVVRLFRLSMRGRWSDVQRIAMPDTRTMLMLRIHFGYIRRHLHELRGLDLGCFCGVDQPCHADVLLELANRTLAGKGK